MTVQLFEMDGVTPVASADVPAFDEVPKIVLWRDRAFVHMWTCSDWRTEELAAWHLAYAETLTCRLELPAGVRA